MKTYRLTLTFAFEGVDDVEARHEAKKVQEQYAHAPDVTFKLQEVYENKPPRKVTL